METATVKHTSALHRSSPEHTLIGCKAEYMNDVVIGTWLQTAEE
jgi:hypothetical protein